ncbi:MAG: hypothetical protein HY706_02060 [Candidatus Hydrogenedentes bacterium]|nr:hypothetical protein [Candidatus Hydrogenedentota bacterium]
MSSARMLMVLDDRWFRRGFITEAGDGYAFDTRGEAISLGKAKFHEHLRGILGLSGEIAIGPYESAEHQPPSDGKKTDAGTDAASKERPKVPAEEGNIKASEQ